MTAADERMTRTLFSFSLRYNTSYTLSSTLLNGVSEGSHLLNWSLLRLQPDGRRGRDLLSLKLRLHRLQSEQHLFQSLHWTRLLEDDVTMETGDASLKRGAEGGGGVIWTWSRGSVTGRAVKWKVTVKWLPEPELRTGRLQHIL